MKGHVRKRGDVWYVKLELDRDPVTNKRRQKWYSGFTSKKAAESELTKLLHQMQTGSYVEPSRLTVADYLRKWLADYAKLNVSAKTFERYEQIVNNDLVPEIGGIALAKLQPLQIQGMYSKQLASGRKKGAGGLSPQTVLHHHRVLRKALAQAVRWNLVVSNPADRVEPPRVAVEEVQPIDEMAAAWLIEVAQGTRIHIPITLAVFTGMRRGEILGLRWADIELEAGYLHVRRSIEETKAGVAFKEPKSRKGRRIVSLTPTVTATLAAHREQQERRRQILGAGYETGDLVCCQDDGRIWKPSAFDSSYRQLLKRRKLTGPTFHALRHSHASHLLRSGVDPKVISERLGHSKVAFTLDKYVHLMPGMQEAAAQKIEDAMATARTRIAGRLNALPN
jgi:integrase